MIHLNPVQAGMFCSFGWTLFCRVLLNLLRAVQTVSSAAKRSQLTLESWPVFSTVPTQPASVFTALVEEATGERRKVGTRAKSAWYRNTVRHWAQLGSLSPYLCGTFSGTCFSISPWIQNIKFKWLLNVSDAEMGVEAWGWRDRGVLWMLGHHLGLGWYHSSRSQEVINPPQIPNKYMYTHMCERVGVCCEAN